MQGERIIRFLQEQLNISLEQNRELSARLAMQEERIQEMTALIKTLTDSLQSLEQALVAKESSLGKALNKGKALSRLLGNKTEKLTPVIAPEKEKEQQPSAPTPKERGNNNARRKKHFNLEVREHDIYPDHPDFDKEKASLLKITDTIRYEYAPPSFIKNIYHQHHYVLAEKIISGNLPAAPLQNSHYDASFFAGILQMRYLYSMPVERILAFFKEGGFELEKSTAHGLVKKGGIQLDYLYEVLKQAVLQDDYIHVDETYFTVLEQPKGKAENKKSCKGYFWAAQGHNTKLVHFFYDKGSRARSVLTDYLTSDYRGAIQTDGYACYNILETQAYPNAIRLSCLQHCKRKFLDITANKEARAVVDIMNELYRLEHRMPPNLSPAEIVQYRQQYAKPVFEKLKEELVRIKHKKNTLPKSCLAKAVNYTLQEYPALENYLLDHRYELDNNAIERTNRYISLGRKNSLFFGSHEGAKRAALIYSLACSCRINGINTFEYFKDVLNRLIKVNPNTNQEQLRNLLPDRWENNK